MILRKDLEEYIVSKFGGNKNIVSISELEGNSAIQPFFNPIIFSIFHSLYNNNQQVYTIIERREFIESLNYLPILIEKYLPINLFVLSKNYQYPSLERLACGFGLKFMQISEINQLEVVYFSIITAKEPVVIEIIT